MGLDEVDRAAGRVRRGRGPPVRHHRSRRDPRPAPRRPVAPLPDGRRDHDRRPRRLRVGAGGHGRLVRPPARRRRATIEAVPDALAADSPMAYYFPPARRRLPAAACTSSTPTSPANKARYETASIAFHEAIPGHHLQLAIATELTGLPAFQRLLPGEHRLRGGLGPLRRAAGRRDGPLPRRPRPDRHAGRRLAGGPAGWWSTPASTPSAGAGPQAIDFMAANAPMSVEEIEVEIDRYIGMPGQALAYKIGQREIFRLREAARRRARRRLRHQGLPRRRARVGGGQPARPGGRGAAVGRRPGR